MKVVVKLKTRALWSITPPLPPWKSRHSWDSVQKLGRAWQATDVTIIQCICFACWIDKATEATDTHTEHVMLVAFSRQQCLHESVLTLHLYIHFSHLVLLYIIWNISVHCTGKIHQATQLLLGLKHVVYISTTKLHTVKQNIVKYLLDLALSSSSVKSMTLRSTLDLPGENTVGVFDCCLPLSCDVWATLRLLFTTVLLMVLTVLVVGPVLTAVVVVVVTAGLAIIFCLKKKPAIISSKSNITRSIAW